MEQSEYAQLQYFDRETDHDDTEAAVEFLAEVRVPCLICSVDVEISNIIKREISESDDWTGNTEERPLRGGNEIVEYEVFHGFLKWFEVEIVKKGKQRSIDRGWDGEGGDILRFCKTCIMELQGILKHQNQLDELQVKIKNGLKEIKKKMELFEVGFQSVGIYEKDHRYKIVRSKIVNCAAITTSEHPQSSPDSSLKEPVDTTSTSKRRRSSRIKTKTNVFSSGPNHYVDKYNAKVSMDRDSLELLPSSADRHIITNIPDVNAHISSVITTPTKKVPVKIVQNRVPSQINPKTKKQLVQKIVTGRKATPICEKLIEEKVCRRKSARISSKEEVHAISGDHAASQDNTNVVFKKSRSDLFRNWNYKFDPSTNTLSYGSIKFSVVQDLQHNVTCTSCNVKLRHDKRVMRLHIIKCHANCFACWNCEKCGKFFSTKYCLKRHEEKYHGSIDKLMETCPECGKIVNYLYYHMRNHHMGPRPFKCTNNLLNSVH